MRLLFDLSLLTAVFTDISVCILILNYVTYGSLLGLQHIGDVGVITGRKAMFRKLFGNRTGNGANLLCETCKGSGKCRLCKGKGTLKCRACGGSGKETTWRRYDLVTLFIPPCKSCLGSGSTPCSRCLGSGHCKICKGTGRMVA